MRLCHAARTALAEAMKVARAGRPLNGIGAAIESTARRFGFRVIENLASHGVGRALHEEPAQIAGYYDPADTRVLHEGMVITIEPFLSTRSRVVDEAADGWTLVSWSKLGSWYLLMLISVVLVTLVHPPRAHDPAMG